MGFKRCAFLTVAAVAMIGVAGCGHIGGGKKAPAQAAPVIGVNGYLWRATLDTLAFMPLQSADPFGGTVITDWYSNPEKPDERFKATVYILDSRLRADGLKVTVFKQVRDAGGNWAGRGFRTTGAGPERGIVPATWLAPGTTADLPLTRCRGANFAGLALVILRSNVSVELVVFLGLDGFPHQPP